MKLHDLRPAAGAHTRRTRVGRGIAAGGGKTAGRGTKGQKARAGGSIPAWFEGGQTPLHQRIPKLRGFKNPFKTQFEIVNLGRIAELVELGALEPGELPGAKAKDGAKEGSKPSKAAPITINQELLRAVGAVRTLDKPLKVLGQGEIDRPLFVVADAFSKTAVAKIEAAGGSVQVIEIPIAPLAALGVEPKPARVAKAKAAEPAEKAAAAKAAKPDVEVTADLDDDSNAGQATKPARSPKTVERDSASKAEASSAQAGLPSEGAGVARRTAADSDDRAEPAKKAKAAAADSDVPAEPAKKAKTASKASDDDDSETPAPSADAPAGEDA
jgi:large subunit ribosomal protein L15